jgi:hypothetical protein
MCAEQQNRTERCDVDCTVSDVFHEPVDDRNSETRKVCAPSDCARTDANYERKPASSVAAEIRSPNSSDCQSCGANNDDCQSPLSDLLASQRRTTSAESSADDCKDKSVTTSSSSLSCPAKAADGADDSKPVTGVEVVRPNDGVRTDVDPASPTARREPVEDLHIRSSTPVDKSSKTAVSDVDSALLVLMKATPHRTLSSPFTSRKYEPRSHVASQLNGSASSSSGSSDPLGISSPAVSNSGSGANESPVQWQSSDGVVEVQTQCINSPSEEKSVAGDDESDDVNERSSSSSSENIFSSIEGEAKEISAADEDDAKVNQRDCSVSSGDDSDEDLSSPWTETQQFRHNDSFAKKDLKQWHFHSVASPPPKRFAFRKPDDSAVSSMDTNLRDGDAGSNGMSRGSRRVAFDPLTLCLNAALEGELDTLKEAFTRVSSHIIIFLVNNYASLDF